MKILCVCDQGNNRSVTFAHLLKYSGHETLSAGLDNNTPETLTMLYEWADKILLTAQDQIDKIPLRFKDQTVLFDVGNDSYPRPFNATLLAIVKQMIKDRPIT